MEGNGGKWGSGWAWPWGGGRTPATNERTAAAGVAQLQSAAAVGGSASSQPARGWWSGYAFALGAAVGLGAALLLTSSNYVPPTPWRKERFGRGALRVPPKEEILDRFRLPLTAEDYEDVRATWKRLALARAKKDGKEAAQCFAQDCSIEDCSTGHGWRGRGGVEDYYADLFKAFPDANFETLDLFIGPQGVVQEVLLTATHKGQWQSYRASGRTFHCRLVILMPWDAQSRLFAGEKIYLDSDDVFQQQHGS